MRKNQILILVALAVTFISGNSAAENIDVTISSGYSIFNDGSNIYWQSSYNFGLEVYYRISRHVHFGGHFAYGALTPRDGNSLFGLGLSWTGSGDGSLLGVMPSVRFLYAPLEESTQIFGQIGIGYCFIDFNATYTGRLIYPAPGDPRTNKVSFKSDELGMNAGIGVKAMLSGWMFIELYPSYNVMFTAGDAIDYVNFSAGLNIPL
jgi:hypothetical protein